MPEEMGFGTTVLGLMNGMIGSTILVLPVVGQTAGWFNILLVCTLMGSIGMYSALITVWHMGKAQTIKETILIHFKHNRTPLNIYNFTIWISFVPVFAIYFRLICIQIRGLLGHDGWSIGPLVFIGLFVIIIFIRYFHIGEQALAFGIFSIFMYLVFILWVLFSAPSGNNHLTNDGDPVQFASILMTAYAIQFIFPQNIIKNPNKDQYVAIAITATMVPTLIYAFIAIAGAYGIFSINQGLINRDPIVAHPQIISNYFETGGWQITLIELLYMGHLITAFPNFVIVSKIRFMELLDIPQRRQIEWHEVVYIAAMLLLGLIVYLTGLYLDVMLEVYGAVFVYIYNLVYPVIFHFYCVHYSKQSGHVRHSSDDRNQEIQLNECQCTHTYYSKWTLYLQTVVLVAMVLFGGFMMILSLRNIFFSGKEIA